MLPCSIKFANNGLLSEGTDGIVFITTKEPGIDGPENIRNVLKACTKIDENFANEVSVVPVNLPALRLVFSPTGEVTDYDSVSCISEASRRGILRAVKAGIKNPLLVLPHDERFPKAELVSLLAALEALYVPIQLREDVPEKKQKVNSLLVCSQSGADLTELVEKAQALESGRVVARDVGGGDPERMTAIRIEEYVRNLFDGSSSPISMEVINDEETLLREYPLFAAVNRAASVIERHRGRIIYLRYEPEGKIEKTLYLVGKGITYDTGGADIKISGLMVGMSRDKCGAAAVAGLMQVLSLLKPAGVRVVGAMCLARNSVGENAYVADEVITSRSKARVRIGNTDAEGRMVMADVLCKLKEEALDAINPHLMTIATLTGHACLAVGHYSIVMDNSVARRNNNGSELQAAGDVIGDEFEISILRKVDLEFHKGEWEGDDVKQCSNTSSSRTPRGHQGPGGFLILASGLDKHGLNSDKPLSYSHLDIAGSAGDIPAEATGAPILALLSCYFPHIV